MTRGRARGISVGLLLVLLIAAGIGSAWSQSLVENDGRTRFQRDVNEVEGAIQRENRAYVEVLQGARAFVLQSEFVTRKEWDGYVALLDFEHRYRALRALSLDRVVPASERPAFEARVRNDTSLHAGGYPFFSIHPEGERATYVPVEYIAPWQGNEAVLGYDLATDPRRADALERAWRTDEASATRPIGLLASNHTEPGILIVLPVFRKGADTSTPEARHAAVESYVVAIVSLRDLVGPALVMRQPLEVQVRDAGAVDSPEGDPEAETDNRVYSSGFVGDGTRPVLHEAAFHVELGGRLWAIRVASHESYIAGVPGATPVLVALVGVAVSVLAGGFSYLLMTSNVRASEEAQRLTRRLQESERRRALLVNNISHELMGALTPVHIQALLLQSQPPPDPETLAKTRWLMGRSLDHLKRLVEDLRDVARLESGILRLDTSPFQLGPVVQEAVSEFQETARERGVLLRVEASTDAPVEADRQRVLQILRNLLSNALNFTPRGGHVQVRLSAREAMAVVQVEDSGRGLGREEIGRLFQPFSQVHTPGETSARGTGLGLYISKGLVEGLGGRMGCESPGIGAGSTFWFELPLGHVRS